MKRLFSYILALAFSSTLVTAQETVGLLLNDSLSFNGYSLFGVGMNTYLVDNCGFQVNSWAHDTDPGLSTYLTEDGTLIRCGRVNGPLLGSGNGGLIEELDWEGNVIWSYQYSNDSLQHHHDISVMNNGNILLLAWELKNEAEVIANGAENSIVYWPDHIIELQKQGTNEALIVWEWHVWDHLVQDFDSSKENYGVVSEHPELINLNAYPPNNGDWNHLNSIYYNETRDEIIVSSRFFSEIWIIDHSTSTTEAAGHTGGFHGRGGDLLYRFGNPQNYGRGTADDRLFYSQHSPSWIIESTTFQGEISVFNNGVFQPGDDFSSIQVFAPPIDSQDHYTTPEIGPFGPTDFSWSYSASNPTSFLSTNQGSVHGLPNGNFLIDSSAQGHFFEVTEQGQIVWEYQVPIQFGTQMNQGDEWMSLGGGRAFRVERYSPDFHGFNGQNMESGLPIELNPLPSDCIIYESVPTFSINPSEELNFDMLYQYDIKLLTIINTSLQNIDLNVFDLSGRKISSQIISSGRNEISLQHLVQGMYLVHVTDIMNRTSVSQKLIIQN
jgi:hypothetical protein